MATMIALLGPASMAMHATESGLDVFAMYLVASFTTAYALMRLLRLGVGFALPVFVVLVALCEWVATYGGVPVVGHAGNAAFATLLVVTVVIEAVLMTRGARRDNRWGYAALGSMAVAFGVWLVSHDDGPWCEPTSWLQGHGVWHLLGALASYCLYRLYASERQT